MSHEPSSANSKGSRQEPERPESKTEATTPASSKRRTAKRSPATKSTAKKTTRKKASANKGTTGRKRSSKKKTTPSPPPASECIVVGVGASAGGLDAFKRLLSTLPHEAGIAYVLVQHLDPNHDSLTADLLSRHTSMPVVPVEEPCPVAANRVYLIPPNKFIKLSDGYLMLDEPIRKRGMRLPIDFFFRSLAEERAERAVCVVLSGTGTDGTQGLKEVKAAGGLTIAQNPASAEYDGMPRSAVATGLVDFVTPIEEIPDLLLWYAQHPYALNSHEPIRLYESAPDHFKSILGLLQAHTDYDFRCYKKGTLNRRIQRRMGLRHVESLSEYLKLIRNDTEEVRALFKDLLIGVTRFFREHDAWDVLDRKVIAPLVARKKVNEPVRIWVPGCSTGEEVYTIAMLLQEQLDRQKKSLDFQVFATDLDAEAVDLGRNGVYSANAAADIKPARLKRFFVEEGERLRVNKRLRESCVFAAQNLVSDPPFSNLDLISCRNVMIYLEAEVQRKLTQLFHFALNQNGCLFLGNSESIANGESYFSPVSKSCRIYRKKQRQRGVKPTFPVVPGSGPKPDKRSEPASADQNVPLGIVEYARKQLLDRFAPASVLIDGDDEIRYFHGHLRDFLQIPSGEPSRDLFEMAAEGLGGRIRGLLREARMENKPVSGVAPKVRRNGDTIAIEITVIPLDSNPDERLFLVSFTEAREEAQSPPNKRRKTTKASRNKKDDQEKVDELEDANSDLSNLLTSTEIAAIFLDTDFCIRRFTPVCNELLRITPSDVGRSISDLSPRVTDPDLCDDARQVLKRRSPVERVVHNGEDRTFIRRVLPYRTSENRIEGVVITFTDISPMRRAFRQVEIREAQQAALARLGREAVAASQLQPVFDLAVRSLADTLEVEFTKILQLEKSNRRLRMVAGVGWDPGLTGEVCRVPSGVDSQAGYTLQSSAPVIVADLRSEQRFQGPALLTDHEVVSGMSVIIGPEEKPWGVLGIHSRDQRDFTVDDVNYLQAVANILSELIHRHRSQSVRRDRERRLKLVTDSMPLLIAFCDRDLVYRFCNARYQDWFGLRSEEVIGRSLQEVLGDDAFRAVEPYARRVLNGEHVTFESRIDYRHGPARDVRVEYLPHFGENDQVEGFYAMIEDISDRIRNSEAKTRLAAIVEHSHDAVVAKDLSGTVISWNAAAERIYGYTAEEMVGRKAEVLVPAERRDEWHRIMEKVGRGEPVDQLETIRRRKDGELIEVLVTLSPIPDADGNITGTSAISHDMTGLRKAERSALESADRLHIAKDAAALGIYDYDPRTGKLLWDEHIRELWGVDSHEEVSLEMAKNGLDPSDRDAVEQALERALDPNGDGDFQTEYRLANRQSGEVLWIAATGRVQFEDGEPVRMVGTVQDITARKTAEMKLEEWADRMEERVAERTAVAEQRAADLRSLAAQITNAEQRAKRQLAEALHDDLQQILAAAKMRLPEEGAMASGEELQAVASLLDDGLQRTRSLIAELSPPVLHEGTLANAFRWLARHMEKVHQFQVDLESDEDLGNLDEDGRTMVFNGVREFLFNAVKHSGVRQARLEIAKQGENLRILVADHGKGFDPNIALNKTESCFGLFNIRERIDAFGGSLNIESAPGTGARFQIEVPLGGKTPKKKSPLTANRSGPRPKRDGGNDQIRILIADDHKIMRQGLRSLLEREPTFEIVGEAADGMETVEMAHTLHPDLVIMDISMPKMNGIEATRQIVESDPDTQVIGLSLHEKGDLGSAIVEAGAATFLQKDVASERLIQAIKKRFAICTSDKTAP